MDIIQQKLVWLMGSGAILILLFKLNLRRAGVNEAVLTRVKIGFALLFAGSLMGIITKIGMSTGRLSPSGQALFFESIAGYVLGWAFVVAGVIRWTKGFFDRKGKPLVTINARVITEKVASSLIKGNRPSQMLDSIAGELAEILECQALSLHKYDLENGLRLAYDFGLSPGHKDLITSPADRNHMFWTAASTGQAVASEKDLVFGDGTRLSSREGPLRNAISVPVRFENNTLGVLTAYRSDNNPFIDNDLDLLEIMVNGLGISLESDISEKKYDMVSRYREMLVLAARPFENGESLISALIKSAKLIHGYVPFKMMTLFMHGDGDPQKSDFKLSTGGTVAIRSGYFSPKNYPELNRAERDSKGWEIGARGITTSRDKKSYMFDISGGGRLLANLKIDLGDPAGKSSYMPLLGSSLCQRIGERLSETRNEKSLEKTGQWLGAMEYFQTRGLQTSNIQSYLKELSSLIVDLAPATFSRIIFTDSSRKQFRTVALVQARELSWPANDTSSISLPRNALHRKAVDSGALARFGPMNDMDGILGVEELRHLMPKRIKHGLIVPLFMGKRTVGVLTVGEAREHVRHALNGETESFIRSVAALMSMVLTWHKDKRNLISTEGKKSLKFMKKESTAKSPDEIFGSSLRTRLNGPLASILASCEFLKSREDDYDRTGIDHYLGVIQRSAARIHDITQKPGEKVSL